MCALAKFKLTIMDPDSIIYKNNVTTLFVPGDNGDFELLSYHYPVLCLLRADSDLIINWKEVVTAKKGIVRFFKNDCVAIVELRDDFEGYYPDLFKE